MERLTERIDGWVMRKGCHGPCRTCPGAECTDLYPVIDRLAAYEDTGLTPEEIEEAKDSTDAKFILWVSRAWGLAEGRLHEILRAEKDGRLAILPPNDPLTLEELREMDGEPVFIVSKRYGNGWCIVQWHGVSKSWMYFSRTGTAEGMTATPITAREYGDDWSAYRRKPED